MISTWGASGGLNAGLSFALPLDDAGAGAVNLVPRSATGSPTPTFTRATTATTILSTGLIASVASGTARSCYSPAGVYLGYLAEEARTNLCLQSADFTTTWAATSATVSANTTTAPDGNATADSLVATAANSQVSQTFVKAASALPYALSVYVKPGAKSWVVLTLYDGTANGLRWWFNVSTGALGSSVGIGTPFTLGSASIVPAANGFYRCTFVATSNTATALKIFVQGGDSDTNFSTSTSGTDIILWGAQLEQAAFATSYIPTTTVAVTRNEDRLTYPTAGNIDGTAGVCYVEATDSAPSATSTAMFLSSFSGTGGIPLRANGGKVGLYDGTANIGGIAYTASSTVPQKLASRWSAAGAATTENGGAVTTTTGVFDGDLSLGANMAVGNAANTQAGAPINGTIKNVRIWTRPLADSQLVALTTP